MPVVAQGLGLRKDYTVTLPASTPNEDFLQIIDDGIQVRNRNFIYSTDLVRYGVLSCGISAIVCFLSCYWVSLQAVAAVRTMTLQHHEFELRLRDAKRLRLYVQSGMAEREMQSASLKKAELECRRLELEAKESTERAARAEAEIDEACHEVAMAKLATEVAVNTRTQIEFELA